MDATETEEGTAAMKGKTNYSLYLVTDRNLSLGRSHLEIIKEAIAGGVTMVQLGKGVDGASFQGG